jgi:hypothetical protein
VQQADAKIYNYAKDISFWRAPYKWATGVRRNRWLCKGHVILMPTLQLYNKVMNKYMIMPRTYHFEGRLYDYVRDMKA